MTIQNRVNFVIFLKICFMSAMLCQLKVFIIQWQWGLGLMLSNEELTLSEVFKVLSFESFLIIIAFIIHCPTGNWLSEIKHEIQRGKRDTTRNSSCFHVFLYFSCYIAEILIVFLTVYLHPSSTVCTWEHGSPPGCRSKAHW